MNILNVTNCLNSEYGGGNTERTFRLTQSFQDLNNNSKILTLNFKIDDEIRAQLKPETIIILPILSRKLFLPFFNFSLMAEEIKQSDIIHLIGHWSFLNVLIVFLALFFKKPYVLCPAGSLNNNFSSDLKKKLFNLFFGNFVLKNASLHIAITDLEFSEFLKMGISRNKIRLIPNGVFPSHVSLTSSDYFIKKFRDINSKFILFMGRLNYLKGPDILLRAFLHIHNQISDYHLVFAGRDEGMLPFLKSIVRSSKAKSKIHFVGHLNQIDKHYFYSAAALLVVPSRNEAMSLVALEVSQYEKLALVTKNCGFHSITKVSTLLESEANEFSLSKKILAIMNFKSKKTLEKKYREFINANFNWLTLAKIHINVYKKVIRNF